MDSCGELWNKLRIVLHFFFKLYILHKTFYIMLSPTGVAIQFNLC